MYEFTKFDVYTLQVAVTFGLVKPMSYTRACKDFVETPNDTNDKDKEFVDN